MAVSRLDCLARRLAAAQLSRRAAQAVGGTGVAGLTGLALVATGRSTPLAQEATTEVHYLETTRVTG